MTKKEKNSLLVVALLIGGAIVLDQANKARKRNTSPEGSISSLPENKRYNPIESGVFRPIFMDCINYPHY